MSSDVQKLKQFAMTSRLIEHDLDHIEAELNINLERNYRETIEQDDSYYPQIEQDIRSEAASMAPHYEMFYSLEKTMRRLVADTLSASDPSWWTAGKVPPGVRANAEATQKKEIDSGVTPRSDEPIDFCTFGELSDIIVSNWTDFAPLFSSSSPKAVQRVIANLNTLRGPIAHCAVLAPDEVLRLKLTVRDWFRLME